jgi:cold shock CspA family protein
MFMTRLSGKIKWFNAEKSYGFIEQPNAPDVFVHGNDVQGKQFDALQEGQIVEFEIGPGPKGPQARRVRVLAENKTEVQNQPDNNAHSLPAHIDVIPETGAVHQHSGVENRNKLASVIANFFLSEYKAHLNEQDRGVLSTILDSCGVTFESLDFALSVEGAAVSTPDEGFLGDRVFHLWNILQPAMANNKKNRLLQIFCKAILNPFLNGISHNNAVTLAGIYSTKSKANLEYTRYLNSSFLGVAEFDIARSLNDTDPSLADSYYRRSIEHLLQARRLSIKEDRFNYGMVGVANYYVAKSLNDEERSNCLLAAIDNLEQAEDLGDSSTEHLVFLGNSLLEHAENTNLLTEFERAINKLEQAYIQDPNSSNIVVSLARANLLLGISTIRSNRESGASQLKEAVRLFDLFETLDSPTNYAKGAMRGRRGQAHLQLWYVEKDINILNKAIEDLGEAAITYRHSLANAFFERYNAFRDTEHVKDLEKAREINDQIHLVEGQNKSHLKQRGRIYFNWAETFSDMPSLDVAIDSFLNCLPTEDPEITEYIGAAYAERGRRVKSEDDFRAAIQWLEQTSEVTDRRTGRFGLLPKVYRELAQFVERKNPDEAISYYDKAIQLVRLRFDKDPSVNAEELDQYNGILGTNYFNRYDLSGNPQDIYLAREYYQGCYDLGSRNLTFLALFGNACLKIAKITDEEEERKGFTEDAVRYLELSREEGNENSANFSKLGEAYLRLYRHYGNKDHLSKALMMFLESLDKGNESYENYGLIGDCYYAQARYENSVDNLYKALDFKDKSRQRGFEGSTDDRGYRASWKEHFSLVGRINLLLFERDGLKAEHFVSGLNAICEAAREADKWPWPVCQLAEVIDKYPEMVDRAKLEKMQLVPYPDPVVWDKFLNKDSYGLWSEGATLSARRPETKRNILGGKSEAYVEDDSHGLLSATFVFKPPIKNEKIPLNTRIERLREERQRTVQLRQYLDHIGDSRFLVPTPLEIISLEDVAVYCMRRAVGRTLGDVIQRDSRGYSEKAVRMTVSYLAAYHAWHPAPQDRVDQTLTGFRDFLRNGLSRLTRDVGLPHTLADEITETLRPLFDLIGLLPLVEKKDSHTENWIVTNNGKIVMLDIELPRPRYQFLLGDMVQLVEDLPFLPLSFEGWQARYALVEEYLSSLEQHSSAKSISLSFESELMKAGYLALIICRALINVGLAFAKQRRRGISISSASRWSLKERYYFDLIQWVPSIWIGENISLCTPDWERITALVQRLEESCLSTADN